MKLPVALTLVLVGVPLLGAAPEPQEGDDQAEESSPASEPIAPAADLPEAIRNLLLGVGSPSASPEGVLAAEGTVLPERAGLVRRTPYGEWAFLYIDDDGQAAAMVLLPCRQLERLVESIEASETPAVRLTGQLTVYDDANYLLPTNYSIIAAEPAASSESRQGDAAGASDPLDRVDPSLRAIAEELEAGRVRARALEAPVMAPTSNRERANDSTGGEARADGEAIESDTLQEGEQLLRRRARLVRQRGLWTLRFDDGQTDAGVRPPLIVLPNAVLRSMERSVQRYGDQIAFEVSGTIYRYGLQPYVLISMHFVQPLEGLTPRG